MEYAYPRYGYFSCGDKVYSFDPKKDADIAFGESPQKKLGSKVCKGVDITSSFVSLASGVVVIGSLFTPLGPLVTVAAVAGGSSAIWGAGRYFFFFFLKKKKQKKLFFNLLSYFSFDSNRSIHRLVDKGTHDEDMADLESFTLYFSLIATPLSFASSVMNARLIHGAITQGRIFSNTTRTIATILNFTTLGVNGTLLCLGIANLVEKGKAEQLTPLDLVQFSMSVFFFANTVVRPQTASGIIRKAQEQHFQQFSANLNDESAKQTFSKFMNDNKGGDSITERSKIVRTLNRIENPDSVFKGLSGAEKIEIGGRKGRTLLVTDKTSHTNRINPNK